MTSEAAALDYNTIEHNGDRDNGEKSITNDVVTTPLLPKTVFKHSNVKTK